MQHQIKIKRVYERASPQDGARFLVDRLWPRGVRKEALHLTGWVRDVAPSQKLRKWFGHDPARWTDFRKRYRVELAAKPDAWVSILDAADDGNVTLLFSAHDLEHNNAVALKEFLQGRMKTGRPRSRRLKGRQRRAFGSPNQNRRGKENTEMKVAVYDTYVMEKEGGTMHFDIVVSQEVPHEKVLEFGKEYLKTVGQEGQPLSAKECEFCHIEQASPEVEKSIITQGFHIIEMEGCR